MPDGTLFLTMAYYDGETLKQRIEQGPWPIEEAVDVAIQLAQALAKAHESAIVHRDIKPANIMIAKNGLTKILDFGLAKLAGRSDMTRTGTTLGTVAYMSPEQIRGGDVGAGTDVWSLGVVLYEMLTGRRPFEGKDDLAVVSSILDSQPEPVGKRRADVPPALQKIVARALDKNAASRYRSATELVTDLVACRATLSKTGPQNVELLRLLRKPVVAVPAAVLLLAASVMAVIAFRRSARVRSAHEVGIPQIARLVEADKLIEAFALAKQVERAIPNDPALAACGRSSQCSGRSSRRRMARTSTCSPTRRLTRNGSTLGARRSRTCGWLAARSASESRRRDSSRFCWRPRIRASCFRPGAPPRAHDHWLAENRRRT